MKNTKVDQTGLENELKLLTVPQFAEHCQISVRSVGNFLSEFAEYPNSGVFRLGRSVRIKPEVFIDCIAKHRATHQK